MARIFGKCRGIKYNFFILEKTKFFIQRKWSMSNGQSACSIIKHLRICKYFLHIYIIYLKNKLVNVALNIWAHLKFITLKRNKRCIRNASLPLTIQELIFNHFKHKKNYCVKIEVLQRAKIKHHSRLFQNLYDTNNEVISISKQIFFFLRNLTLRRNLA